MNAVSPGPQGNYRGLSGADRQRLRRGRLVEAALEIMSTDGWRTATVDLVCSAAGLNKRYFYESFPDLDSLAAAVVDEIATDVGSATLAAFAEASTEPLERQAFVCVDALVRTLVRDPRRARVLFGGVAATPEVHAHRAAVMNGLTQILVGQARVIHGVELEPDPMSKVAPAFVVGGTSEAVLSFVNGSAPLALEELIEQLTTLWLITGNGAAEVARERTAGRSTRSRQ